MPHDPQPLDLDAIDTVIAAATPGPWGVYEYGGDSLIEIAADLKDTGTGYSARRTVCRLDEEPLDNDPAHREWTAEEDWAQVQADAVYIATMSPETVKAMAAEIRRLRAELATARERYTAGLRKADEHVNAMSEEVKRYADGEETPVLWSVYNAMHSRAATAEGCLTSIAALCDAAEKQATRWEHPLPVPEWVDAVRQAMQQPAAVVAHVVADDSDDEGLTGPHDCGEGAVHYTLADCPAAQRAARP